jgi:hypothetical protein
VLSRTLAVGGGSRLYSVDMVYACRRALKVAKRKEHRTSRHVEARTDLTSEVRG